jgi:hypothetical protein
VNDESLKNRNILAKTASNCGEKTKKGINGQRLKTHADTGKEWTNKVPSWEIIANDQTGTKNPTEGTNIVDRT